MSALKWSRSAGQSRTRLGPMHLETMHISGPDAHWQAWAAGGCVRRSTREEAEAAAVEKAVEYARAILDAAGVKP